MNVGDWNEKRQRRRRCLCRIGSQERLSDYWERLMKNIKKGEKIMKSKWLISVGLVVCLVMAFALPMCAPAPAPPEEEEAPPEEVLASSIRTWVSSSPDGPAQVEFIERKLGIQCHYIALSAGESFARMEAEAPRFSADLLLMANSYQAMTAKDNNWAIPYDSPTWRGDSEVWKDPDNYFWAQSLWNLVLVGHEGKLAEAGYTMPESWDDLLDPKWKGQILMPSGLTSGTGWLMIAGIMTLYGFNVDGTEKGGWEYLEALDKNINHYTKSGSAPVELVSRGEFMLGISGASSVVTAVAAGYPIAWRIPKEGVPYEGSYAMIMIGTEELYTCQKIIDLWGTQERCEMQAAFGHITKDPDVGIQFFEEIPKYIDGYSVEYSYENRDRVLDEWKDRFLRAD